MMLATMCTLEISVLTKTFTAYCIESNSFTVLQTNGLAYMQTFFHFVFAFPAFFSCL